MNIPATPSPASLDEPMRAAGLAPVRERNNRRLVEALSRLRPPPGRLLDVGCGPGFLLTEATACGYAAEGLEPDANVVEAARRQGAPVRQGLFPEVLGRGETFDVIVFNDVLEHIADVTEALRASAARLKPGGVLCLNCPDRRGLFFRSASILDRLGVRGPHERLWQRGLPSPHLWYFTPGDLARIADRSGLVPAGTVRLDSIALSGLWRRIRYAGERLPTAIAAYLFSLAAYPVAKLAPSDSVACLFRKPGA